MPTKAEEIKIEMQDVVSSNIAAVGYDRATKTLRIQFNFQGQTYDYQPVPAYLHTQMMKAESVNAFFTANIKGVFRYKRVK